MRKISRESGKETMLKVLGYCFQTFPWSFSRMLYVQHGGKLQCLVAKKSDAKKKKTFRSRELLFSEREFMSWGRLERDA